MPSALDRLASPSPPITRSTLGHHLLLELYDCDNVILDDVGTIQEVIQAAADAIQANTVNATFHRYQPQGVSGVLLLAESHLSVHTWPERAYAAVDAYTCGDIDPCAAIPLLRNSLNAKAATVTRILRGHANDMPTSSPHGWLRVIDLQTRDG
jgi:S-adenosylmethionine decarboxylase proenzyme